MAVAEVDVVNQALRIIGARPIAAIDDTTPGGAVAGDVLSFERDAELRAHLWNFAAARARLPRLVVTPRFEYRYAYAVPSDWVRTVSVHDNDAGTGQARYKQETILTAEALSNGGFDSDTIWTKGAGWTISGGSAAHASGSGSDLSQTVTALVAGELYRVCFLIAGMSAGTLTPKFTGGSTLTGTARSADGYYAEELTATAAHTALVLSASSDFNGTVDDASVMRLDGAASPAIISSCEAIFLRYVRKATNPDQWDPLFRQAVALRLAKRFALTLTNSSTYFQLIDAEMKSALRIAKSTDSIEDWPEEFPDGSWVTSRGGSGAGYSSWAAR